MNRIYEVAGHRFRVSGEELCKAVERIGGFKPFEKDGEDFRFDFVRGEEVPDKHRELYRFLYEDVTGVFGRTENGFTLVLKPAEEEACNLWCRDGAAEVNLHGNLSPRLLRFALWIGYGLMTVSADTVAIHSSCIVHRDKAVLFLGESGTGKSTHTRLWREHIEDTALLNDDSPILRMENDKVWVYGSPWSGKTPCYKAERHELQGCVRLSQAAANQITRLSVLQAYGAIHPSCPPEFAYDGRLYDRISDFLGRVIATVPFYHLACLPDGEAARLSCRTLYPDEP